MPMADVDVDVDVEVLGPLFSSTSSFQAAYMVTS